MGGRWQALEPLTVLAAAMIGLGTWYALTLEEPTEFRQIRDLEPGTCFWRKNLESPEWGAVRVVPCDDQWQFAVLNTHWIDADGPRPDDDFFFTQASAHCESGWTLFLNPTPASWGAGDRLLLCLTEPGAVPPRA